MRTAVVKRATKVDMTHDFHVNASEIQDGFYATPLDKLFEKLSIRDGDCCGRTWSTALMVLRCEDFFMTRDANTRRVPWIRLG